MSNPSTIPPALVTFGEGRVVRAFGEEITFLLEGKHTGDKCTTFIEVTPPGCGPPPHYHLNEDEWFHVLEGRVAFLKDGQWIEAGAGDSAFMPRGAVHAFKNVGDQPLRQLITVSPSGFETFMTRCAVEFAKPGPPDMERIVAISVEHGIHFVQT